MPDSVISTQTSYPISPDTSLGAYNREMGNASGFGSSSLARWFKTHLGSHPSYQQWRAEKRDQYNADLEAYNSYITSLAGQKAQAEEAGFNPAWLGSSPGGGTSPLDYQQVSDPSDSLPDAAGSMISGVGSLLNLVSAGQAIKTKSLQNDILGQELRIKQAEADAAPEFFGSRAALQGFKADWQSLTNDTELFSRYEDLGDTVIAYNGHSYVLNRDTKKGNLYQGARSAIELRSEQKKLASANYILAGMKQEEQRFYIDNIQPIMKEYWEGKKSYQETVNAIYEESKQNEMNNRTANNFIKVFAILANVASRIFLGTTVIDVDALTGEVTGERKVTPTVQKPK